MGDKTEFLERAAELIELYQRGDTLLKDDGAADRLDEFLEEKTPSDIGDLRETIIQTLQSREALEDRIDQSIEDAATLFSLPEGAENRNVTAGAIHDLVSGRIQTLKQSLVNQDFESANDALEELSVLVDRFEEAVTDDPESDSRPSSVSPGA